jgi:phosphoribosylformimino-5-aminoimidazole carboxamide ribonucleotide (ProFAR) isomerase
MRDIEQLRPFEPDGIRAVIIGRAIYTGAVDLAEAIRVGKGP